MRIHAWGSETAIIQRQHQMVRLMVDFSDFFSLGFIKVAKLAKKHNCVISKHEKTGVVFNDHKMEFTGHWKNLNGLAMDINHIRYEKVEAEVEKQKAKERCPYCERRY